MVQDMQHCSLFRFPETLQILDHMKPFIKNTNQIPASPASDPPDDSFEYFDRLIYWKLHEGHWYTVNMITELFSTQNFQSNSHVLLINASNNAALNLECMECILSQQDQTRKAIAVVTGQNLATYLLVGFYLNMNKPGIPVHIFKTDDLARAWLKKQLSSKGS
jgi:hypothetical protein